MTPSRSDPEARAAADAEDRRLMGRVRDGDQSALGELYERHGAGAYGLARRVLGDATLAQDVVQEVFLAVWRDPERYDGDRGAFGTWLLTVTHHRAVDVVRREEALRRRQSAAELLEVWESAPDSVADVVWTGVRGERVRAALGDLPPPQREALALAYFGGYTQREIAGLTGAPLGTVKTRMLAGMRRMREALVSVSDTGVDEGLGGPGQQRGGVA
jgi:RNA polymerase sigma factor (sigma-70 family)